MPEAQVKIKMLATTPGSPDGIRVLQFKKDEVYDVPVALAKAFVTELKVATEWPLVVKAEEKMASAAPENKAAEAVEQAATPTTAQAAPAARTAGNRSR